MKIVNDIGNTILNYYSSYKSSRNINREKKIKKTKSLYHKVTEF